MFTYYALELNQLNTVSSFNVTSLFTNTYKRPATMEVTSNSSTTTGLVPCNRNIFHYHDIAVHTTTLTLIKEMLKEEISYSRTENFIGIK